MKVAPKDVGKPCRVKYDASGMSETGTIEQLIDYARPDETMVRVHFRKERRKRGYATIADNHMTVTVHQHEIVEVDGRTEDQS